ncbi:hypothetical protein [Streptomyces sp. NPDC046197]|uniref:Rv1733c family protein n=1 Tax=Streptomyces sp. NPDC046197 TaxID=3154337 RepID=UPI0033D57E64
MRTRVRTWRWRHNPLRRRSDVVEAWTALVAAVLLLLGAPLAGVCAAWWAHDEARGVEAAQRADRHSVRGEVVGGKSGALPSAQSGRQHAYRVAVRWTEPGRGPHTGVARVPAGTRRGDLVDVWFDTRGRNVPPPTDDTAVWQHTLTLGACAAGGAVVVVLLARSVVGRFALRRRLDEWEREWARTGPEWTRRSA